MATGINLQKMRQERALGRLISVIARIERSYFSSSLKPLSLTASEMSILILLHFEGETNQEQISKKTYINKVSLSRMCTDLVSKGYICRMPSNTDKRSHLIGLTLQATQIIPQLLGIIDSWTQQLSQGIAEQNLNTALQVLEQASRNIEQLSQS